MSYDGDLIPPDESMWRKYSPHHEFPLSSAASVVIHFFIALVVAFFGTLLFNLDSDPPPAIDNLDVIGGGSGGQGEWAGTSDGSPNLKEHIAFDPFEKPLVEDRNRPPLLDRTPNDSTVLILPDEDKEREKRARGFLDDLVKVDNPGQGGSGRGGRRGDGIGNVDGDGIGDRRGGKRAKRMHRWSLSIPFTGADDYADRLQDLGAILMIEDEANERERDVNKLRFWVYRDLARRPVRGTLESLVDLARIDRVYFKDRSPETVAFLIESLGLPPPTTEFTMFLPRDLEAAMLQAELKAAGVKFEDELNQKGFKTTFRAERSGNSWNVRVMDQKQQAR